MHPKKKQYSNEVLHLVSQLCCEMTSQKKQAIPQVLNISVNDAKEIIKKVMIALPDKFFYNSTTLMLYDMLTFISKNIVLFQVQEDIEDESYALDLMWFISCLTSSIAARYYSREIRR